MTNETVGDAISDMLLVETILHSRGWSVQDWNKSYQVRLPLRAIRNYVMLQRLRGEQEIKKSNFPYHSFKIGTNLLYICFIDLISFH